MTRATAVTSAIVATSAFVALPARSDAQSCSSPYLVEQPFPITGTEQTRWRVCWLSGSKHGLVISSAHFRKSPASPWMRVFWDARVSEIFVPYHSGNPRFLDLGYVSDLTNLATQDCPSSVGGSLLGSKVCKEVRDRGLAWKHADGTRRRGQEVALWGAVYAGNYVYVIEWVFRDDGVVLGRVAATGANFPPSATENHMHSAIWRLDIDLNGFWGDAVHQGIHTENVAATPSTGTDTDPLIATEGGIPWDDAAFHALHVHDATLKNGRGSPTSYHLMPLRSGTVHHNEPWTTKDFWVTRYNGLQMDAASLVSYSTPAQSVSSSDIVVWYVGSIHHSVRDEDGQFQGAWWHGVAQTMWTGFMLKPHNLFDGPPLYP